MIIATTLASGALLFALAGQSGQDSPDPLDPAHMDAVPTPDPGPDPEEQGEEDAMPSARPDRVPDAAMTDFTDAEIAAFASAALEIRAIHEDAVQDEAARDEPVERAEEEAIIARHGLDPETYSAIANAAQQDPAVAVRVQQAVAQMEDSAVM